MRPNSCKGGPLELQGKFVVCQKAKLLAGGLGLALCVPKYTSCHCAKGDLPGFMQDKSNVAHEELWPGRRYHLEPHSYRWDRDGAAHTCLKHRG